MILFVDLDGTLWEHELLDEAAADALRAARDAGHLVFLCTGRSAGQIPAPVAAIGFDGMITNGGGTARIGKEVIAENVMTREQLHKLLDIFERDQLPYLLESDDGVFGSQAIIDMYDQYIRRLRAAHNAQLVKAGKAPEPEQTKTEAANFHPLAQANLDHIAKICFFSADPKMYDRVKSEIGSEFYLVPSSMPMPGGSSGEVAPLGVSKGTAIHAVLKKLGLDRTEAIGIGDSHNDIEMFDACGTAIAMGNAVPELLEQADFVTTAVLQGGVRDALQQLGLIEQKAGGQVVAQGAQSS